MDGHAAFERVDRGAETDVSEVDGRSVAHDPAPALFLEVNGSGLFGVGPHSAVSKVGREFKREGLVDAGKPALEEPGLLGEGGVRAMFVLVGDDAAWVASGSFGHADLVVVEKISDTVAVFGHLIVLDRILVAVGTDAPD